MFPKILSAYGLRTNECTIQAFGTGLINQTWKISSTGKEYILQRINHEVFRHPAFIAENINALGAYLDSHSPEYLFIRPLLALDGKSLAFSEEHGYFRLSPFVPTSYTYDVVGASQLAYEAARQFGKFTKLLAGFPVGKLHFTLPDFHNLSLRYQQFKTALTQSDPSRIGEAAEYIEAIRPFKYILEQFEHIKLDPGFKTRVVHHDTKISNVLFDAAGGGLCVIDLDTVMPGYFISDFGDMMRTYLSPVSEEEKDFSRITVREDYFKAIVQGYLGEMKDELSVAEIDSIVYAGKFMVYMQAIRFLTDHLNYDRYYGAKYEGHNLVRAGNQITLLQQLAKKENLLNEVVTHYIQ